VDEFLPYIVALGGGAGVALVVREIVNVVTLVRKGVSATEGKRKNDIVAQRDTALQEAIISDRIAKHEAAYARKTLEYASRLRRKLFEQGTELDEIEEFPEETTLTREQVKEILKKESKE
jgi:hypothetical protein